MVMNKAVNWLKKSKKNLAQNVQNIPGWTTGRRLIVFESDDWGSIRMPSRETYEKLLRSGDRVDQDPFIRYDALASESDLQHLFDTLTTYRDSNGRHPVITANCAVANPDFDKIRASEYREYFYEPFTETLKRYPQHKKSFELWLEGIDQRIFCPQLHGREHLNVARWMRDLRAGKADVLIAFDYRMIGTGNSFNQANKYAYMDAFNFDSKAEIASLRLILKEGIELFQRIFGYPTKSFIAPCYVWNHDIEAELAAHDIRYLQGGRVRLIPQQAEGTTLFATKRDYLGKVNPYGQLYLKRNCSFEPSWDPNFDWVNSCMREIAAAFRWKKPATVSVHRLNFIGFIDEVNRRQNLELFSQLLSKISQEWPDIEFITSVELGDLIGEV